MTSIKIVLPEKMVNRAKLANAIRKTIGDPGFEFGVREWRDGEISVWAIYPSQQRRDELARRLEAAGYRTIFNGTPGTTGEWEIFILGTREI